jgi:hypothetical protein
VFNRGSYTATFREEIAENMEGALGRTFIMVKWERGAWYRECVIESDAAKRKRNRSCPFA